MNTLTRPSASGARAALMQPARPALVPFTAARATLAAPSVALRRSAAAAASPAARRAPAGLRGLTVRASASPQSAPATPAPAPVGVKVIPAAVAIGIGLLVKFVVPAPAGITEQAWSLFAIFLSTIMGLVLEPLPVGAWAFLSLTAVLVTKTLPFAAALSAMTNEVIWLIVISFFFAKGFEKTGLGERIANLFVKALGKSTLGLAYGLAAAETFISPAMPSTTARAGERACCG